MVPKPRTPNNEGQVSSGKEHPEGIRARYMTRFPRGTPYNCYLSQDEDRIAGRQQSGCPLMLVSQELRPRSHPLFNTRVHEHIQINMRR